MAGINLNPYQGLKPGRGKSPHPRLVRAGINLNPYQGLKLEVARQAFVETTKAGINLNPYQGLKRYSENLAAVIGLLPEST